MTTIDRIRKLRAALREAQEHAAALYPADVRDPNFGYCLAHVERDIEAGLETTSNLLAKAREEEGE